MIHFLSDSDETFRDLLTPEGDSEPSPAYPFAYMLACAGYMLTMFADSIIAHVYSKKKTSNDLELQGENKPNQKSDAWRALWTITLHKAFAAIAMGIALLRMIPDSPLFSSITYSFAIAISSPIGVGIGIVIDATTQGSIADWIYAVSMSLTCGVFVYVSVNHLLAKGYVPNKKVCVDV